MTAGVQLYEPMILVGTKADSQVGIRLEDLWCSQRPRKRPVAGWLGLPGQQIQSSGSLSFHGQDVELADGQAVTNEQQTGFLRCSQSSNPFRLMQSSAQAIQDVDVAIGAGPDTSNPPLEASQDTEIDKTLQAPSSDSGSVGPIEEQPLDLPR
jgi:hypothetical protein